MSYTVPDNIAEVRARAWATRRQKYGERGHRGSYSRGSTADRRADQARDEISVARRSAQILLPSPAAHKIIDALDLADDILAGRA
jgi:hypothetical protein